jgi:hypothetical protein
MFADVQPGDRVGVGTACTNCGRRLPLRFSESDEEPSLWECVGCHAPFAGVLMPDMLSMLSHRVRLNRRHLEVDPRRWIPGEWDALLEKMAQSPLSPVQRELRRSPRVWGRREAFVVGADHRFHLVGCPVNGVIGNLSSHGMLLITSVELLTDAVIVESATRRFSLQLLGRIVWTHRLDHGCFGTGIELVARLGKTHVR